LQPQTVYQYAHKVEPRLAAEPPTEDPSPIGVGATTEPTAGPRILLDKDKLKELTITAFAMGVILRPIEGLLGVLLPTDEVPDHEISFGGDRPWSGSSRPA